MKRKTAAGALLFAVLAGCWYYLFRHPQIIAAYDFSAYYCGAQLFFDGRNPYDAALLDACQKGLGRNFDSGPAQLWYGPWALLIMLPVMKLPYDAAAAAWLMLNMFFILGAGVLVWKSSDPKGAVAPAALAAAAFFSPNIEALSWNQMGPLMTFGLAGFLWALAVRRDAAAGFFLVPAIIKPHIFFLFAPVFLWWSVRRRRLVPLLAFCCAAAALGAAAELLRPGITGQWFANIQAPPLIQQTPTAAGILRGILAQVYGAAPAWPAAAVPGAALAGVLLWIVRSRPRFDWPEILAPLFCWSLFLAPYAFIHDQCILLIAQVQLAAAAFAPGVPPGLRRRALGASFGLQAATAALGALIFPSAPYYFWFPAAVYAVWRRYMPQLKGGTSLEG